MPTANGRAPPASSADAKPSGMSSFPSERLIAASQTTAALSSTSLYVRIHVEPTPAHGDPPRAAPRRPRRCRGEGPGAAEDPHLRRRDHCGHPRSGRHEVQPGRPRQGDRRADEQRLVLPPCDRQAPLAPLVPPVRDGRSVPPDDRRLLGPPRRRLALGQALQGPVSQRARLNALLRRGLRLEYATLAWNVAGVGVLAVAAVSARSVALAAFGLDSLIEILASAVVVWQLRGDDTAAR